MTIGQKADFEPLLELSRRVRGIIEGARADGVTVGDGNVVDLLADNIMHVPLGTLREALVVAGYSWEFPHATLGYDFRSMPDGV